MYIQFLFIKFIWDIMWLPRQLSQRAPAQVSALCESEFDKGIEGKLIELFDVPNGIELNQVKDTLQLLLSSRFGEKLEFWMSLVGHVFQDPFHYF